MKLQQLRYIIEVARQSLNVSTAAKALHTSQPAISNQIQQLEEELGLHIFERHGKRLTGITPFGQSLLTTAERMLLDADNIKQLAADNRDDQTGTLSIGTTHTQARYALPKAIQQFSQRYPNVHLNMIQGTPTAIADMAAKGKIDIAIATEGLTDFESLVVLPCYNWNRSVVVPPEHPLLNEPTLTLQALSRYPLLTYALGFTGRAQQDLAFTEQNLTPNVIFTATDADVIKTYVELGLGIGIIASMAFDHNKDAPLKAIDAHHLFKASTTHLGIRKGSYLRHFAYEFIELLSPKLTGSVIEKAVHG